MKFSATLLIIISCLQFSSCSWQASPAPEWQQLFNGNDLNDWIIKIKDAPLNENVAGVFSVEEGVIKVNYENFGEFNEQFGHLFYKKPFSTYLLGIEYRFTGEQASGGPGWAFRNAGVMLHCQSPESMLLEQDFPISLEAQFLGGNGKDQRTTGNLCTPGTNVVLNGELFTPHCINSNSKTYHGNQWVRAEVLVLNDSLIHHIIESDTVLTYSSPQYDGKDPWVKNLGLQNGELIRKGYIALQAESHPIEYRKVEIIDLSRFENDSRALKKAILSIQKKKK